MIMKTHGKIALLTAVLLCAAIIAGCGGQDQAKKPKFPEKPLTYYSWNDPGSSGDQFVRAICKAAEKQLGQPINIVVKTGGNGAEALSEVIKAPADGYALSHYASSLSGFMSMPGFPYKPDDFEAFARVQEKNYMLAINADLPIKNLDEFVEYARKNPEKLRITGSRVGGVHHQIAYTLAKKADFKITYVPAKGGSEALKNTLGGHVDGIVYTPIDMLQHVKSGKLRPIVNFTSQKDQNYPDVPLITETKYKFDPMYQINGLMLKKGVPEDVKAILVDAFKKAMDDPEFEQFLIKADTRKGWKDPKDFQAEFVREYKESKDFMTEMGILK
ncbi:MAG: hypothetical protein VR68_02120 [Peptococcaceae bacterium BRH_c4a]|nr:MAG: hypothetical protein VR68_02120 [Peptococcaceae bacterium BRH_c4a]